MKDAIHTSYERDVINGDAESRAQWFSYAGGTIITSALGTKGAGTVTKAGTATVKTGIATTKTKIGNMEFRNSFGRDSKLAFAGSNNPYNVYNGNALKSQHLQFAENFKDGKSGVNKDTGELNKDLAKAYLRDTEVKTGRKVNKEQIHLIKEALRNKNYEKLTPKETAKHRSKFTSSLKDRLIAEWEEKTNQK